MKRPLPDEPVLVEAENRDLPFDPRVSLPFRKRAEPFAGDVQSRRAKLEILCSELRLLFEGHLGSSADASGRFITLVSKGGEPSLSIGHSDALDLAVGIEPNSGFYLLSGDAGGDCILLTSSEAQLMDQIVSRVASTVPELAPRTADGAIDVLIGCSLESVMRRFVLRSLLHFNGDRGRAASSLGVTEADLQYLIGRYLQSCTEPRHVH